MESSSLTPDSCVCYRQESRISRELIALVRWLHCPHRLLREAWIVRSLMPGSNTARAQGSAFAEQKEL
jgi:hypothetical protein